MPPLSVLVIITIAIAMNQVIKLNNTNKNYDHILIMSFDAKDEMREALNQVIGVACMTF